MPFARELQVALDIARRAGELALRYFEEKTETEEKEDASPVTIADRECEKLISRLLNEAFPEDGILGEEGASLRSRSGRRWLIDPIDGTRDFVRRTPFWAVQLALEAEGGVVAGVIHLPFFGDTLHAVRNGGCFWNGGPARASTVDRIEKAVLMISGFPAVWDAWPPEAVRRLTERCWTVRAFSGCYDIAMMARGKADIWLSGSGMPWDYAPAVVIARECGARFLTRSGGARIDEGHCLITAPALEAELRGALRIGRDHGE